MHSLTLGSSNVVPPTLRYFVPLTPPSGVIYACLQCSLQWEIWPAGCQHFFMIVRIIRPGYLPFLEV